MGARVPAKRVDDVFEGEPAPGSFNYFADAARDYAGMTFVCPCGCGSIGSLAFRPDPSPSWSWDGNVEAPTLSPSILHQTGTRDGLLVEHYHGFLRAGVWESV